ncbi:hypothetical protein D918_02428 [Trichuris suis]|nr:hypothetical protein D918_02428 [Trichuris suis]
MDITEDSEASAAAEDSYLITIEDSANGDKIRIKVCGKTQMYKVFKAFCEKSNRSPNSVRFMYNGKRVDGQETALSLGIVYSAVRIAFPLCEFPEDIE